MKLREIHRIKGKLEQEKFVFLSALKRFLIRTR